MRNTIKTYTMNGSKTFQIGDKFFIGMSGGAQSVFGENAELTKITKMHLVFKTDSDQIVKTKIDNLNEVIGKLAKQNVFVSEGERSEFIKRSMHI